jgi:anti-sigma regulatory factor (Ser/Thr protein kinase)
VTGSLAIRLQAGPTAARRARDALVGLRDGISPGPFEDVRLLVSELVTNSIRHAGLGPDAWIDLRAKATPNHFRVEVSDSGPGFQYREQPLSMYQTSGWGLYLVERIADRWGVDRDGSRTTVWFEMDLLKPASVDAGRR